jgi:hypothetical protein
MRNAVDMPGSADAVESCSENILNRNPSESGSEFGIAIRNDRLPTATPIPIPNYKLPLPPIFMHYRVRHGACGTGEKCELGANSKTSINGIRF